MGMSVWWRKFSGSSKSKKNKGKKKSKRAETTDDAEGAAAAAAEMAEEDGDEDEEDRRDYNMHRLAREERLKGKKLRGKRKRKETEREKGPGQDFRVDVADERFAAVLEGDMRFGIDCTDSSFKDTEGMRSILEERARRKDKKNPGSSNGHATANGSHAGKTTASPHDGRGASNGINAGGDGGANGNKKGDLSLLVNKFKTRGLARNGGTRGADGGDVVAGGSSRGGAQQGEFGGAVDGKEGGGGKGRRGKKKRRKA